MREVFICDAVRTPIGRYGGALAKVRTDDLAAVPIKALMQRASARSTGRALDEVIFGCANQAGEDNRNVARMALLLAGLPDIVPGVTVNRLCASGLNAVGDCGARDPRRRDRLRHRRRRRVDDARAVRHGQGAGGVPAQRRDLRHHHRLALHQSADEAAVRRRRHAGDRRERRRGITRSRARTRTRLRCARSSAPARRTPRAISPRRSCRSRCRAARPGRSRSTRTSIRGRTRRWKGSPSSSPFVRNPGTVTAGNASGVNDGAAAMILASRGRGEGARADAARAHHSAWRRPACRRASWASARCRRRAS